MNCKRQLTARPCFAIASAGSEHKRFVFSDGSEKVHVAVHDFAQRVTGKSLVVVLDGSTIRLELLPPLVGRCDEPVLNR